mgnify:CR=1 FL=1
MVPDNIEAAFENAIEDLAAIEHERWAHWQRYLHDHAEQLPDGSLRIPPELVARWESQMGRSYAELDEKERASDRDQVRRYLPRIAAALRRAG